MRQPEAQIRARLAALDAQEQETISIVQNTLHMLLLPIQTERRALQALLPPAPPAPESTKKE